MGATSTIGAASIRGTTITTSAGATNSGATIATRIRDTPRFTFRY
jgi:hypothetical protein